MLKYENTMKHLYKKENNIFQSEVWAEFQQKVGRELIDLGGARVARLGLPLGKNFDWAVKSDLELPAKTESVFVRFEPENISLADIKKYNLKLVTKNSLLSGQKSPKATRVLDVSKSEEEILGQMKPKTRYNIRLAAKKGVTIEVVDDAEILYDLLQKTSRRDKGYQPHDKEYYQKMVEVLAAKEKGHVFVAKHDNDFLAAIFVTFYGELAIYLHGGFNEAKRNLMAPYLCQWEAIKYAKKMGCKYYDFWGVAESDDPKDSWAGITRFKEGFGGEKIIFPGTFDYVVSPFWYNILTLMAKIKHLMRR
jgi:lipid II:glycine glycyltransferase (peptidoglycan interpeptide bridge formation enzyme)